MKNLYLKSLYLSKWSKDYFRWRLSEILRKKVTGTTHILLLFVDHFELDGKPPRLSEWMVKYPLLASKHADADGMLVVGSLDANTVLRLESLGRPMVLIDNNLPHLGIDRVLIENVGSTDVRNPRIEVLGVDVARYHCSACHSTDYIVMQPRGDAKQWDAVVTKMIKVFGAPLSEADARAVTEYLTSTYGPAR